jgi:hypothetical protein
MQGMLKEMFQKILFLEKQLANAQAQLVQVQEQLGHVQAQLVQVQARSAAAAAAELTPVTKKQQKKKKGVSAAEIRTKNTTRMDGEAQAYDLARLTNARKFGDEAVRQLDLKTKTVQLQQVGVLLEMAVSSRNAVDILKALCNVKDLLEDLDDRSKKKFMKRFQKPYEKAQEQLVQAQAQAQAQPEFAAAPARPVPERPVRPVPKRPVPAAAAAAEWTLVTTERNTTERNTTPKKKSRGWCQAFKNNKCQWGDSCQHGHHENEVTECYFGTLCTKVTCYFKHTQAPICTYYANNKVCPHHKCNYSHSTE